MEKSAASRRDRIGSAAPGRLVRSERNVNVARAFAITIRPHFKCHRHTLGTVSANGQGNGWMKVVDVAVIGSPTHPATLGNDFVIVA